MKVKVISDFRDREENLKLRKKGEILEVDEKRAAKLISLALAEKEPGNAVKKKGEE